MFEDTTKALVECPESGEDAELEATISGDTLTWACPSCGAMHTATIDYGDDDAWLEGIDAGRVDCE